MMKYDDCYPGCGGEDCVCCEIYADHNQGIEYPVAEDFEEGYELDEEEEYEDAVMIYLCIR